MSTARGWRPPWFHGWNIVAVSIVFQIAGLGVALNCFTFFAQEWTRIFDVPMSQLALVFSALSVMFFLTVAFVGRLCDLMSVRHLVMIGLALTVIGHALMGAVTAVWQIFAIYIVIMPFSISFTSVIPAQCLVTRWFDEGRGFAMGLVAFGVGMAGIFFPPLVVALIPSVGWRATWWIFAAAFALIVMPLTWFVIRDWPSKDAAAAASAKQRPASGGSPAITTRAVFARRNFWMAVLVFLSVQIPFSAMLINLAPFAAARGAAGQSAALLAILLASGDVGSKLVIGFLCDRVGNRLPLIAVSIASMVGLVILIFAHGLPALALGCLLFGCAGGIWTLLSTITADEFPPESFGRAYGLISMFTPLSAFGPPVLAFAQEQTGSYATGLTGMAVLAAIGIFAGLFYKQPRRALSAATSESGASAVAEPLRP